MQVYDVFAQKTLEVSGKELITFSSLTKDFIVSIPHGGLYIPAQYLDRYIVDHRMLVNTDMHTQKLYAMKQGITVSTQFNPFFLNMGRFREGNELAYAKHMTRDPFHQDFLTGGQALKEIYTKEEKKKLLVYYDLYHRYLQEAISQMRAKYGFALVFDCHSMLSYGLSHAVDAGEDRADFVVGTRDDTSANPALIAAFVEALQEAALPHGFSVVKNHPYKGGFITQQYGKPQEHVHVIQLEIAKKLYMDEGQQESKTAFHAHDADLRRINKFLQHVFSVTAKAAHTVVPTSK